MQRFKNSKRVESKSGSIDMIFGAIMFGVVGVSIGIAQVNTVQRSNMASKYILDRNLQQANQSSFEIFNAALRAGKIKIEVKDPAAGELSITQPEAGNNGYTFPNWKSNAGVDASTFSMNVCTPFTTNNKSSIVASPPVATQSCVGSSDSNLFTTLKIKKYFKIDNDSYLSLAATTSSSGTTKTTTGLMLLAKSELRSCTLVLFVNNHHGCGPYQITDYELYIPGAKKVPYCCSSGTTIETLPISKLQLKVGYGRAYGYTSPPWVYDPGVRASIIANDAWCVKPLPTSPPPSTFRNPDDGKDYILPDMTKMKSSTDCDLAYASQSPLVITLNQKDLDISLPEDGVYFDLQGSGEKQKYAWPRNKEAYFLAYNSGKSFEVVNTNQLFGNNTTGPDGKVASNGFEALKKHVNAGKKTLDQSDEVFSQLFLWHDLNRNGISESNEVYSLKEKDIKSIDLNYKNTAENLDIYGSHIFQRSSVTMMDGTRKSIVDFWPAESRQDQKVANQ